jgi:hypothetical protein
LFNTQRWFVAKNRITAETYLPVHFLETAYISHCSRLMAIRPELPTDVPPVLPRAALGFILWLGFFRGGFSPTAPTAPSLRPCPPSGSLIRCQCITFILCFHFQMVGANYPECPVIPHCRLLLC